ncbi:MAG TPA: winged helix-turn-helix domain-containing protein [Cellvibrio sp.]
MTIEHNIVYRMEGFTVNVTRRQIITPQQTHNVRPKTFSLLLQFLENPLQVLSKDLLLNKIWDDVAVEEQVLVQSIRELRQLFAPLDVIQTHPRKGYAWVIPVEKLQLPLEPVAAQKPVTAPVKIPTAFIALGVVALLVLGVFAVKHYVKTEPVSDNVITVLPVNNRMDGSNLSWVRLGMMDQLIQSLQLSPNVQVFDVPYVLNLLQLSAVDTNDRLQLANRIFEISGSSLVVDLELSGYVNDYRLLYRLFTPTDQSSGVIMENQLGKVVEKLANIIATKTDARLDLSHLNAEFNSSLIAEAVEKASQGQSAAATALLNTAVTIEPDNFLAYQLLIESAHYQQDWPGAISHAKKVIAVAEQHQFARTYVFYYLLASAELAQGDVEQARHYLFIAQELAEDAFDSLYQAYVASLWGDIAVETGDLQAAEISYQRAMKHYQAITCPIGMVLVHRKLIELYASQKKNELLLEHRSQLKQLIEKHKLPMELPALVGN